MAKKVVRNDEGKVVPEHCSCGGKIGVFIEGEPIYKCTACGKYYGTMPFPKMNRENKNMNKKVIKINKSQLREMITESVKKVLKESLMYDGAPIMLGDNNAPKKIYYVIFACSDNYFKKEEKKFKESDKALAYAIEKIQATYFKRDFGDSEDVTEIIKAFRNEFILKGGTYEFYLNANGDECFVGVCDVSQVRKIREELSELRLDRFDIR